MAKPDFDSIKHLNPYNVEYREARELMPLLGYGNKWQNFVDVIKKAMISCETTGNIVTDHFTGGSKMVALPHEKSAFVLFTKPSTPEVVYTSATSSPLGSCSFAN